MITPQLHVVYNNWFQIVSSSKDTITKCWRNIFESERYNLMIYLYDELQLEQDKKFKYPELVDDWFS